VFFISCAVPSVKAQTRDIIGYYPSWKWRAKENGMTVNGIPYSKLTTINYAFWYPRPDGTLAGLDSTGDRLILGGCEGDETSLITTAHRHGVSVLLALGGWENSDNFPAVAADPKLRSAFASSCVEVVRRFGFDGIDVDWEFPGDEPHNGTPADRDNFTLLLREVRDSLDAHGRHTGKTYSLTAALPAGEPNAAGIDIKAVTQLLDRLNLMTYDFHGPWDARSGYNSPLYASGPDDRTRSVDAAFRLYRDGFSVAPRKINLGIPFYGHVYAACDGPNKGHSGPDTVHFSRQGAFYHDIAPLVSLLGRKWDERAQVPWLVHPEWRVFVSYDDPESVREKARYVVEHGAAGVIIWEITGDYLGRGRNPLLDVIYSTLGNSR
jgi:chitinase